MIRTATALQPHRPDFVSITYGAGGGTRKTTMRYAKILKEEHGFEVMPHLTCVGPPKMNFWKYSKVSQKQAFKRAMALRGDPPKAKASSGYGGRLAIRIELVALIRDHFPEFGIGVGGYPEKHPEARISKLI